MLKNNKCILAYGLSSLELDSLKKLGYKVIEVTSEMCEMTVNDILSGIRLSVINANPIKAKAIIYNNFLEFEMKDVIRETRNIVKDGVLAMVTPTSISWKFNYLIKHLIEEREWYLKNRKE